MRIEIAQRKMRSVEVHLQISGPLNWIDWLVNWPLLSGSLISWGFYSLLVTWWSVVGRYFVFAVKKASRWLPFRVSRMCLAHWNSSTAISSWFLKKVIDTFNMAVASIEKALLPFVSSRSERLKTKQFFEETEVLCAFLFAFGRIAVDFHF